MKHILYARWLLMKRDLPKMALWLILPLLLTVVIIHLLNQTSDDFRVPVALVVEGDAGDAAEQVIEGLKDSDFIHVEQFDGTHKKSVIRELEQYQYDSVFIFKDDFEEQVNNGERRNLMEAHFTDQSFYYDPAKELIASLIQEKIGQYMTVERIFELQGSLQNDTAISAEEISSEREHIKEETNLIDQTFYFLGDPRSTEDDNILDPWIFWSYISFMVTLFIFDFITRESVSGTRERFSFMKYSYKIFLSAAFLMLTLMMFVIDLLAYFIFGELFEAETGLLSLAAYRIVINGIGFLSAYYVKSQLSLYQWAIAITILLLALHSIMPMIIATTGMPVLMQLHPVMVFTDNGSNVFWLIILIILMLFWIRRHEIAGS